MPNLKFKTFLNKNPPITWVNNHIVKSAKEEYCPENLKHRNNPFASQILLVAGPNMTNIRKRQLPVMVGIKCSMIEVEESQPEPPVNKCIERGISGGIL